MGFHIFPVTGVVREEKTQSFYTGVMDGMSSLGGMVSDRLVAVVFYMSARCSLKRVSRVRPVSPM